MSNRAMVVPTSSRYSSGWELNGHLKRSLENLNLGPACRKGPRGQGRPRADDLALHARGTHVGGLAWLSRGFDSIVPQRLVGTNRVRTAAWSLRGRLVLR